MVTESQTDCLFLLLQTTKNLLRFCSLSSLSLPVSPSRSLSVCPCLYLCLCQLLQPLLLPQLRSLRVLSTTVVLVEQAAITPALVTVLETETATNAILGEGLVEF